MLRPEKIDNRDEDHCDRERQAEDRRDHDTERRACRRTDDPARGSPGEEFSQGNATERADEKPRETSDEEPGDRTDDGPKHPNAASPERPDPPRHRERINEERGNGDGTDGNEGARRDPSKARRCGCQQDCAEDERRAGKHGDKGPEKADEDPNAGEGEEDDLNEAHDRFCRRGRAGPLAALSGESLRAGVRFPRGLISFFD